MLPPNAEASEPSVGTSFQPFVDQNNLTVAERGLGDPQQVPSTATNATAEGLDGECTLVKRRHNASLPISRLPVEILATIFGFTLPPDEDLWTVQHAPVLHQLVSVCHTWKQLVQGTPALWTLISSRDPFGHAEQALQLSSKMPLDVIYHCGFHAGVTAAEFFQKVSPESYRWRKLDINHDDTTEGWELLEELAVPVLESLHLEFNADEDYWDRSRPLDLFRGSSMPKLRTATLMEIPIRWERGQLTGGRLRILELFGIRRHAPSLPQILDIVRLSPLLNTLSIHEVTVETGNHPGVPALRPPWLREMHLAELPSAVMRQLVLCIQPPRPRCFTIKTTVMEEEVTELLAPGGLESVVITVLRGRDGRRIYINFTGLSTMVSNGRFSHVQINGNAAVSVLEWVLGCLGSQAEAKDEEVHVEVSYLEDLSSHDVSWALQTVRDIPNVVELTLRPNAEDWEREAALLQSLSLPCPEDSSREHECRWPFHQLQIVTLGGTYSLISIFIQVVRRRLGLDNTLGPRISAHSYPPPIKIVYVRPSYDAYNSFSTSELDELDEIIGAGGGNVYWLSKLWKDWPKDIPHDQPNPVLDMFP
ncbi:hypothetical protein FRC05_002031 [Tulasnella sp. 425]|nr:hypothetical protein FRC05_002031 [Tulasnella sp. 425]